MRLAIFFILLSVSHSALACEDQEPCKLNAMEMFLPEVQRYPASNIRIEKFIYQTKLGDVSNKVSTDKLIKLKEELNNITIKSFKESKTSFEVLAQFKLTPSSDSEFKLQTTGGEQEDEMLTYFYDAASKLTEYKSIKDDVFVFLHYKISSSVTK
ncbi:hypothetical protein RI845_07260 [Thalassotalea nanhaiensis]|uniref:Uncharacterized protein n=1 Tax=Thalassotalea nanhaiensis TaxID=3065648 RepID=A0ABY9TMG5_9GAMM|nr:hypothetical protein RI845_07260 [Colwelliaceae bacterium SQ345]